MNKNRGPNDLEQLLEQRQEELDMLKKQKEYMQKKCREAGEAILKQEGRYLSLSLPFSFLAFSFTKILIVCDLLKTVSGCIVFLILSIKSYVL